VSALRLQPMPFMAPRPIDAPRERPTTARPEIPGIDVASGGAIPAPAELGASAAAEARRTRVWLAHGTGIREIAPVRYGPTSHVSEAQLFYAYRNAGTAEDAD